MKTEMGFLLGVGLLALGIFSTTACSVVERDDERTAIAEQPVTGSGSPAGTNPDPCADEKAAYNAAHDALWECQNNPAADCHDQVQALMTAWWNLDVCGSNATGSGGPS